jgi:hypothetical protein
MLEILVLGSLRQEDHKSKFSLGYLVSSSETLSLKQNKTKAKQNKSKHQNPQNFWRI